MSDAIANSTRERAARSGGTSEDAIYTMVQRALQKRSIRGEVAVDLGCGRGALQPVLAPAFSRYIGCDAVRYDNFPASAEFIEADLNAATFPIQSQIADAVFAIETIEHLENPRALLREMVRIAKPGAWLLVTTPNQLSLLSLGALLLKNRFSAFQEVHYPAHITALLESDLAHIARELNLRDIAFEYTLRGRIPLTPLHYPATISRLFPRKCSDNILLIARAP
jgi:2-polyprenyl-3-methyl-5-hydroxy-6-metoxy-1,4-benzoquinol methylase